MFVERFVSGDANIQTDTSLSHEEQMFSQRFCVGRPQTSLFGYKTLDNVLVFRPEHSNKLYMSVHFLPFIPLGVAEGVEPISASSGEGGVTLDTSPVHHGAEI